MTCWTAPMRGCVSGDGSIRPTPTFGRSVHYSYAGLTVAKQTITNFIEKASRLCGQERGAGSAVSPLEMHIRQWLIGPGPEYRVEVGGEIRQWLGDHSWSEIYL